jgi:rhodanese-related sulfurtransferase
MKNFLKTFLMLAVVSALFLVSCKKTDDSENGGFETLQTYMATSDLDLPKMLESWTADAKLTRLGGIVDSAAGYSIPTMHVVDIRSAADFAAGHINGAVNATLANILDVTASLTDKPVLVVCATGQTAGVACMALRLSGHSDAKVLKFGMAGWNAQYSGPWTTAIANGNQAVGNSNWVTTASPAPGTFGYPTWTSGSTDGATILKERVSAVLNAGFSPVDAGTVLANPSSYSIVNYWSEADYLGFGHYNGAVRINPITLLNNEIAGFDPTKETLVYCYTGMTSSFVTTWLNVLGYNTKSIKFGANALVYDALLDAQKTVFKQAAGFPVVTGK